MNVTDQWMLERMQQIAAGMAASLAQTSQNSGAGKTEKGETFQDLMNKAKEQKAEAPQKADAPKRTEKTEPVQKTEQPQTAKVPVKTDGKEVELTAEQAAMLAAGYAKLIPSPESDMVLFVTAQDENGNLVLPLQALENDNYAFRGMIVDDGEQWTMEATPELVTALKQLLKDTDDPRPADVILGKLASNEDGTPVENKLEIIVKEPETEQTDSQDDDNPDAQIMAQSKPLFHDVKAAPVKVGENFQLDTRQADMDEQLAETIQMAAQQGLRQVEIRLSPENLGNLTIKLTQSADGALQIVLHAANSKAVNLLNQHLNNLNAALQSYSQNNEVRVEVQRNEDSQQAQQQTDPNGHNRQQQQQRRQERNEHSEDFVQRLRLGLFRLEDVI